MHLGWKLVCATTSCSVRLVPRQSIFALQGNKAISNKMKSITPMEKDSAAWWFPPNGLKQGMAFSSAIYNCWMSSNWSKSDESQPLRWSFTNIWKLKIMLRQPWEGHVTHYPQRSCLLYLQKGPLPQGDCFTAAFPYTPSTHFPQFA